jgi:hypothetical protein
MVQEGSKRTIMINQLNNELLEETRRYKRLRNFANKKSSFKKHKIALQSVT